MSEEVIELGDEVRDRISGFKGIVICLSQWLSGCDRIVVQPRQLRQDGGLNMTESFDIYQVEIVEKQAVSVNRNMKTKKQTRSRRETGGPRPNLTQGKNL